MYPPFFSYKQQPRQPVFVHEFAQRFQDARWHRQVNNFGLPVIRPQLLAVLDKIIDRVQDGTIPYAPYWEKISVVESPNAAEELSVLLRQFGFECKIQKGCFADFPGCQNRHHLETQFLLVRHQTSSVKTAITDLELQFLDDHKTDIAAEIKACCSTTVRFGLPPGNSSSKKIHRSRITTGGELQQGTSAIMTFFMPIVSHGDVEKFNRYWKQEYAEMDGFDNLLYYAIPYNDMARRLLSVGCKATPHVIERACSRVQSEEKDPLHIQCSLQLLRDLHQGPNGANPLQSLIQCRSHCDLVLETLADLCDPAELRNWSGCLHGSIQYCYPGGLPIGLMRALVKRGWAPERSECRSVPQNIKDWVVDFALVDREIRNETDETILKLVRGPFYDSWKDLTPEQRDAVMQNNLVVRWFAVTGEIHNIERMTCTSGAPSNLDECKRLSAYFDSEREIRWTRPDPEPPSDDDGEDSAW